MKSIFMIRRPSSCSPRSSASALVFPDGNSASGGRLSPKIAAAALITSRTPDDLSEFTAAIDALPTGPAWRERPVLALDSQGRVVLFAPDNKVPNGSRLF